MYFSIRADLPIPSVLLFQYLQDICDRVNLKLHRFTGGLRHKQRKRVRDRPTYDHYREAQIGKQADVYLIRPDSETPQYGSKQAGLFFAEYLITLSGQAFKSELLLLDGQNRDSILLTIIAGMEELPHPIMPAQSRTCYQLLRICHNFGLLEV